MLQDGYPGIYVNEIPSGVNSITGASTSNLALLGHFPRGPMNTTVRVNSFADFERLFGGLHSAYVATYAMQQFFQQGGGTAYVVRAGFQQATARLTVVEDAALVANIVGTGMTNANIRIAYASNNDGSFDIEIIPDTGVATRETFRRLSTDPADPRFAERIINAPVAMGGSALIALSAVRHPPANSSTSIALDAMTFAQASAIDATAFEGSGKVNRPRTIELPALTLQAMAGGADGNDLDAEISAITSTKFTLKLTMGSAAPISLANCSIDPLSADFVVAKVAATGLAGVIMGGHPLRIPMVQTAPFTGGGEDVPTAKATLSRTGGGTAVTVSAANPGGWANAIRVGVSPTDTGGFDLIVGEFAGGKAVRSESYLNLNAIPNDPNNAAAVINRKSGLIRLSGLIVVPAATVTGRDADTLTFPEMVPLTGGGDGTLPGHPAWASGASAAFIGSESGKTGLFALNAIIPEMFNLMIMPEAPLMADTGIGAYAAAGAFCAEKMAFLLIDHPVAHDSVTGILSWDVAGILGQDLARSAALCFPQLVLPDPLAGSVPRAIPASGALAGVYARTDADRGVWKAPAGFAASISGGVPSINLSDKEQGQLNKRGLNAMRTFANIGTVNWGARTLAGADAVGSEWKYTSVRRTALFLQQTFKSSLGWVVFEPNDEPLWAQIRLNIGAFMQGLYLRGAFEGGSPDQAYVVKCDGETTTQADVNAGVVNILVGFAPLKPAEFVVLNLTQLAGRLAA